MEEYERHPCTLGCTCNLCQALGQASASCWRACAQGTCCAYDCLYKLGGVITSLFLLALVVGLIYWYLVGMPMPHTPDAAEVAQYVRDHGR